MTTQVRTPADRMVRGWIGFAAIVVVTSFWIGAMAFQVAAAVVGVALIMAGMLSADRRWRTLLILAGVVLIAVPLVIWWQETAAMVFK